MVKHNQTIRQQFADEFFELFDHYIGLACKGLKRNILKYYIKLKNGDTIY